MRKLLATFFLILTIYSQASAHNETSDKNSQQLLLNVNDILEFINSIKKSQDEMFQRVERLAKSVEFTDGKNGNKFGRRLGNLEKKVSALEDFLPSKIDQLLQQKLDYYLSLKLLNRVTSNEHAQTLQTQAPKTTTTYAPEIEEEASLSIEDAPISKIHATLAETTPPIVELSNKIVIDSYQYAIQDPFTPPPLYPTKRSAHGQSQPYAHAQPMLHFIPSARNGRDLGAWWTGLSSTTSSTTPRVWTTTTTMGTPSWEEDEREFTTKATGNFAVGDDSILAQFNKSLEFVKGKILQLESQIKSTDFSSRSSAKLQYSDQNNVNAAITQNSRELLNLRQKQGELRSAIDTVLIHFSTIVRDVENVEGKLEQMRKNFTDNFFQSQQSKSVEENFEKEEFIVPDKLTELVEYFEEDPYADNVARNNQDWLDDLSAERRNQEYPDFTSPSYLKRGTEAGISNPKLEPRSLRPSSQRVKRDLTYLTRQIRNLSTQLKIQEKQIFSLTSEMVKVNVSNILMLRGLDNESIKRTIRPRDCSEIKLLRGVTHRSVHRQAAEPHTIYPQENDDVGVKVLCDMSTDGGGWTLIQRRGHPIKQGEERENFYRNWTEYEAGFGELEGDLWLGLLNVAALSKFDDQELRIELTKWNGEAAVASYKNFKVAPSSDLFRLNVSGFEGNAGDSLSRHSSMPFSSYDRDNDEDPARNCAQTWSGAWWYYGCHESNLNGRFSNGGPTGGDFEFGTGIIWYTFTGNYYSLANVQIKIRNKYF